MTTVTYVAIVEGDQNSGYGAFFPDLPGCVTASETMVELLASARDALTLHLEGMAEDGEAFPEPTLLENVKADPEVKEVARILVDADVEDAPVRVNISIGAQFLKRVDVAAEARGMTRSGFLIDAARMAMAERSSPDAAAATHVQKVLAEFAASQLSSLSVPLSDLITPSFDSLLDSIRENQTALTSVQTFVKCNTALTGNRPGWSLFARGRKAADYGGHHLVQWTEPLDGPSDRALVQAAEPKAAKLR